MPKIKIKNTVEDFVIKHPISPKDAEVLFVCLGDLIDRGIPPVGIIKELNRLNRMKSLLCKRRSIRNRKKFKNLKVGKVALLVDISKSFIEVRFIQKVNNKDGYNALDLASENYALYVGPNALVVY